MAAPGAVVLRFTEPLIRDLSHIRVVDSNGRDVGEGMTLPVEGDDRAMRRRLGLLHPGRYQVRWTTVSPLDGHTLNGRYAFAVGAVPSADVEVQASPVSSEGWAGLAGRVVGLAGLVVWVGTALLRRTAVVAGVAPGRLRRIGRTAAGCVLAGTVVSLVSSAVVAGGGFGGLPAMVTSRSGALQSVVVLAAVAGVIAPPSRSVPSVCWPAVALLAEAASGHAATSGAPLAATTSFVVHVAAAGVWAVAPLAAVCSSRPLRDALRSFSRAAVVAGAAASITGVANATMMLERVHDLTATGYGRTVLLKTGAVVGMGLAGWAHHRRRVRSSERLRRPVTVELVSASVVVVLAGALVGFPNPPSEAEAGAAALATDAVLADLRYREAGSLATTAGPYVVGLTILPPDPGPVELRVQVLEVEPGDALRDATATLAGPSGTTRAALETCGKGCFAGDARLPAAGRWSVDVSIASNRGPVAARFDVPLPMPDGTEQLAATLAAMEQLRSARVDEVLHEEEGGTALHSTYTFAAPDAMRWAVEGGSTRVGHGSRGYLKSRPGAPWKAYEWSDPGFAWPQRFYRAFLEDRAAVRVLGTEEVDGRSATVLAFLQPAYPAWYRLWVDDATDRILRLEMRAERHVMDHAFRDFDEPVDIPTPDVAPARVTVR